VKTFSSEETAPNTEDIARDLQDKNSICDFIFGSGFFDVRDGEPVNFAMASAQTRSELQEQDGKLYDDIYSPLSSGSGWLNPYRERDVMLTVEGRRGRTSMVLKELFSGASLESR